MTTIYDVCRNYRKRGIPLHLRNYTTAAGRSYFWLYYGYAPPIASGLSEDEAKRAMGIVARVHEKIAA